MEIDDFESIFTIVGSKRERARVTWIVPRSLGICVSRHTDKIWESNDGFVGGLRRIGRTGTTERYVGLWREWQGWRTACAR